MYYRKNVKVKKNVKNNASNEIMVITLLHYLVLKRY